MAKGGKGKGGNGGGGDSGGEDGGGGGGQGLNLVGSSGSDRMRGSDRDDTFKGLGGNDLFIGRGGTDTAIYDGSVWDYTWRSTQKGWTVDDRYIADGDDGTDTLQGVEVLQFSDATIVLGQDSPTIIEMDTVVATWGEEIDFTIRVADYDNKLDLDYVGQSDNIGRLSIQADRNEGAMGTDLTLNITFDPSGFSQSQDLTSLALGETVEVVYYFDMLSYAAFGFDRSTTQLEQTIIVTGVNDAPTLAGTGTLTAFEDGRTGSLDLSPFGDDVDSDDTGATLTYEVVSSTDGFDVAVDGTVLTLLSTGIDPDLSSDESVTGEVVVRAVDRHGATSEEITLNLIKQGVDGPATPIYISQAGVDYAGLGVDLATAPQYGSLNTFFPDQTTVEVLTFSDADDLKVIGATRVAGFSSGSNLSDADGNTLVEDAAFTTGLGDDVLIFDIEGAVFAGFELSDVSMGTGEDVLVISVGAGTSASQSDAVINGADIETGANNDQIWLEVASDINSWMNLNLDTGSGHDVVEARISDVNDATPGGFGFFDGSVNLGTGDDSFRLEIDAGQRSVDNQIDIDLVAGDGEDFVYLSNAASEFVAPAGMTPDDAFYDFYQSGLSGTVNLGAGNDELVLDLNDAYSLGTTATLDGGLGYDVLRLDHLTLADPVSAQSIGNDWIVTLGNQTLEINGFEEIWLADGNTFFM